MKNPAAASPIFVHSSFRTSSTWLWHKLRTLPTAIAYGEIFHESLATLDPKAASRQDYQSWPSKHPQSAPYFIEFIPLMQPAGGVAGYQQSMALDSFIPADGIDGHLSDAESDYVGNILDYTNSTGKIPILTCTRTLGRMKAMKRAFGGTHILLHRNLFHQWASYTALSAAGNNYFNYTVLRILNSGRHDPFFRVLKEWVGDCAASSEDEKLFELFLLLHLYLYARVYEASDIVIDVTALATDATLRCDIERTLSELTSVSVDLSDARQEFEYSVVNVSSRSTFVEVINQFTKQILAYCTMDRTKSFIERLKEDALQEWERHEFYSRKSRFAQAAKLADMRRRLDEQSMAAAAAADERETLAAQLSDALAESEKLRRALGERASIHGVAGAE